VSQRPGREETGEWVPWRMGGWEGGSLQDTKQSRAWSGGSGQWGRLPGGNQRTQLILVGHGRMNFEGRPLDSLEGGSMELWWTLRGHLEDV
jgi:hypothetical protein